MSEADYMNDGEDYYISSFYCDRDCNNCDFYDEWEESDTNEYGFF